MAKIEEKRRNSMDDNRAPPKKRFLSRASSPSPEEEDNSDTFKEPLEAFRKDAIVRQWREYRRSVKRWRTYIDDIECCQQQSEQHLSSWEEYFRKLQTFLLNIIQDDINGLGITSTLADHGYELEDEYTQLTPMMSTAIQKKDFNELTVIKLNQLLDAWVKKRENTFQITDTSDIKRDHERIMSLWVNSQHTLQEMRINYRNIHFRYLLLSEELKLLNIQLQKSEGHLHTAQQELHQLSHTEDVVDITPTIAETPTSIVYNSQGISQDPLIHAQQSLEQRLREIELIKEDRISLKQQIARLEMDLITLPESRIYKASLCRQLFQSRSYQKDRSNHLSDVCHDLQNNYDDMCNKRRRLIKELDIEQVNHVKTLEEQLHKLDIDLTRIRGQRDAVQMSLEEKKAVDIRQSVQELKVIADTRKERVSYLETEVLRLQRKMAAKTGNRAYYESYVTDHDPLVHLKNELNSLTNHHVDQIEYNIRMFMSRYGFHPTQITPLILQDRIKEEQQKIEEYGVKMTHLENTEKQLLSEIDSVARAYNELEEANLTKVRELAEIEDDLVRLQSERVKYSQAFTALNKSKDAHAMVANALNKQIEKQLAHIKQLNEREKNLLNQTTILDRELSTCHTVYDIYKQKNDETKSTLDELKEKTVFIKEKITEVQKSILDRIRSIEEGAYTRLRLEESSELLRKKIEATTKVEKPAEMKLRKEREEYRSLLNCSSCRIRLKSHVIMRCMHTFCKECLDIRIETRQRRCPSCGESFSVNDVKQFYF